MGKNRQTSLGPFQKKLAFRACLKILLFWGSLERSSIFGARLKEALVEGSFQRSCYLRIFSKKLLLRALLNEALIEIQGIWDLSVLP